MITIGRVALIAACVLLASCAGKRGGNWIGVNTPEDTGQMPEGYRDAIESQLKASLKDPYSAKIEIGEPMQARCAVGIYGFFYGWRVRVTYNAKNSYGAYVGEQNRYYWYANGTLKRISAFPNECP